MKTLPQKTLWSAVGRSVEVAGQTGTDWAVTLSSTVTRMTNMDICTMYT